MGGVNRFKWKLEKKKLYLGLGFIILSSVGQIIQTRYIGKVLTSTIQ